MKMPKIMDTLPYNPVLYFLSIKSITYKSQVIYILLITWLLYNFTFQYKLYLLTYIKDIKFIKSVFISFYI